jgi:hypothetical protein
VVQTFAPQQGTQLTVFTVGCFFNDLPLVGGAETTPGRSWLNLGFEVLAI